MALITRRSLISAMAAFAVAPAAAAPNSLNQIIMRNARARGGAKRLNAIRTMESAVRITEPTFTVLGRYLASVDGLVRVDVYADGKRVFSEGVDSAGVWSWPGGKDTPAAGTDKGKAALLHTIEFNLISLDRLRQRGHQVTRAPVEPNGLQAIDLKLADGFETRLFVDPVSWQVVGRRDRRAFHVDVDQTQKHIESRFSDFRVVNGIATPFRTEEVDLDTGKQVGMAEILSVNWNVDPSSRFDRAAPAAPTPG